MVDDYVTHLLALLSAKRGVKFVGYAYSYFPGLVQLTEHAHGQAFKVREPDDAEVDQVLGEISQRIYRQNYQQRDHYTLPRHLKGILRYQVKRVVFALKARLERDPWHLHYVVTPYLVERRRVRDFPRAGDFHADWKAELARLRTARPGPVVYMPLGYFPESTTDYWIGNRRILRYEQQVLEMVRTLARDGVVVVKEHLHMMGARHAGLYQQLMATPNVVSVHPMEYSNDVLAAADAVLLGAGSVGVEATLRDTPLFTFCDTSYWFATSGAVALDLDDIAGWPARIRATLASARPLDAAAKREFLRECLRSTVRPRARGRRWPHVEVADLRSMLSAAPAPRPGIDRREVSVQHETT